MASQLNRETASPGLFIVAVLAIHILGILAMALTGIWMKHYLEGFGWDGTQREFDYHPLCMVISLVFLYSEGKIFSFFSMFQSNNDAMALLSLSDKKQARLRFHTPNCL